MSDHNELSNDHKAQSPMPLGNCALYFDLTQPDDERRLREYLDGGKWRTVVSEMDEWLRQHIKYGEEESQTTWVDACADFREHLHTIITGRGLDLWSE